MGPYPFTGALAFVSYANFDMTCINSAMSTFLQYLPFVLVLQACLLILLEKAATKIPIIAGQMERFYTTVVENSLFGADPESVEDIIDFKANAESIGRKRRRNEICIALKGSSIIFYTYIAKNILEVICSICIFLPFNLLFGFRSHSNLQPSTCIIEVTDPEYKGMVHFQCQGKKLEFFFALLYSYSALLVLYSLFSLVALTWVSRNRQITNLIKKIQTKHAVENGELLVKSSDGKDFMFLFDLLSHSAGIQATMRVLTHADDTFFQICKPSNIKVDVEEDKMKVSWKPADIERWLMSAKSSNIHVDSYEVTLYPAETVRNTITIVSKLGGGFKPLTRKMVSPDQLLKPEDEDYFAWFCDLAGGRTEYVITISTIIRKSRMRGDRIVSTLIPYGAERPRSGMIQNIGTNSIELIWEPPKGEFTKYVLEVYKGQEHQGYFCKAVTELVLQPKSLPSIPFIRKELSWKLTEYKILGLDAGDPYWLELYTKTWDVITRQPIGEMVLTEPQPVQWVKLESILMTSAEIRWLLPTGHSCMKGLDIKIKTMDEKLYRELTVQQTVQNQINMYRLTNLSTCTRYSILVETVCIFKQLKRTSKPVVIEMTTLPEPPLKLELESRHCNSITIKWEHSKNKQKDQKYKISIRAPQIDYSATAEVPSDRNMFNFSKLPDVAGSGQKYSLQVVYSYSFLSDGQLQQVESFPVNAAFFSKPLAPTNFRFGENENEIIWARSLSIGVQTYKVKWRRIDEGGRTDEALVHYSSGENDCYFTFPYLEINIPYKVNIYAIVRDDSENVESKELHNKIIKNFMEDGSLELSIYSEEKDRSSSVMSPISIASHQG